MTTTIALLCDLYGACAIPINATEKNKGVGDGGAVVAKEKERGVVLGISQDACQICKHLISASAVIFQQRAARMLETCRAWLFSQGH